jgi:hypothetical protein
MLKICTALLIIALAVPAFADEAVNGDAAAGSTSPNPAAVGSGSNEIGCLLSSVGSVKKAAADEAGSAIENAIRAINFPAGTFSHVCLLQFLSQILAESDHLKTCEQYGASGDKKGWGYIMITGPENLNDCASCMMSCQSLHLDPSNPAAVLGNSAPDRTGAALGSLCWWKKNILNNPDHAASCDSRKASDLNKISKVVNTGSPTGKMTPFRDPKTGKATSAANATERRSIFNALLRADKSQKCRSL